ncbi:unnamed protein product [Brassica rapa subsp. narinosa]
MQWNLPDYFLKRDQNNVLMTKKDVEPDGIKMLLLPPYKPFPSIFSKACNISNRPAVSSPVASQENKRKSFRARHLKHGVCLLPPWSSSIRWVIPCSHVRVFSRPVSEISAYCSHLQGWVLRTWDSTRILVPLLLIR